MFETNTNTLSNFIIEDLIYIPMGNYNPMYNRPFTVNTSKSAIDTISQRLDDTKSGLITSSIINGVANEIIQPSAIAYPTQIDSNWLSIRKYIFLLKVRHIHITGAELMLYIQGFTDYDGITATGNIDNSLVHNINNIIETSYYVLNTPLGTIRKEKLTNIYNVFSNNSFTDFYTQRPNDVLDAMAIYNISELMGDTFSNINYTNMNNYINNFDKKSIASNVSNNIPTNYISDILNYGFQSQLNKEIHLNSFEIKREDENLFRAYEPSIRDNEFIRYLNLLAGSRVITNKFTFNQLISIDPTIYNRFKVLNITKNYVDPNIAQTPDVGDYWTGQDPVTIKAYSLIESSVSLALKYGFSKIYFTASNMINPLGNCEIFITNFNSFINLDERDFNYILEVFKTKYIQDIFLNETNNNIIPLHIDMYVDILGTSKINLTYAGYPSNWYTIPTFANSSFSPVTTINKDTLDYTAFQLSSVIESLFNNNQYQQQHYY